MSLFEIDAETSLRKWAGYTCLAVILLVVIIFILPFFLIGLILEGLSKIVDIDVLKYRFDTIFERVLLFSEKVLEASANLICKFAVSEKARMWYQLNEEKEENENE